MRNGFKEIKLAVLHIKNDKFGPTPPPPKNVLDSLSTLLWVGIDRYILQSAE